MTAAPLSGVLGGPISGALLGVHLGSGFAGWQWMFLLEGLPAIVLGGRCVDLSRRSTRVGTLDAKPTNASGWRRRCGRNSRMRSKIGHFRGTSERIHLDAGAGLFWIEHGFLRDQLMAPDADPKPLGRQQFHFGRALGHTVRSGGSSPW